MGHILAMRKARSGERYILGGDRVTIRNYFQLISECSGRPTKALHIPWAAMLGIGLCFTVLYKLGKTNVPFTYTQARHLVNKYAYYSSSKAAGELNYSWRTAKSAIQDYVEWVRAGRPAYS